jgi:hypothetical protein
MRGGSLLVSTSPRTPAAAAEALLAVIDCSTYCYRWRPNDPENPYLAYLALADSFIVTVDSASQVVEACLTEKPVSVFEWPAHTPFWVKIKEAPRRWLERMKGDGSSVGGQEWLTQLYDYLVYTGFVRPTRDFETYWQTLRQRGLIARLGQSTPAPPVQPLDDMERAVARIRRLFANACNQTLDRLT